MRCNECKKPIDHDRYMVRLGNRTYHQKCWDKVRCDGCGELIQVPPAIGGAVASVENRTYHVECWRKIEEPLERMLKDLESGGLRDAVCAAIKTYLEADDE